MHRLTKALLGSTCLTALSAGAVQAGILTVPDFGDIQAFATDVTGAAYLTGRIDGAAEASGGDPSSSVPADDYADYFSYTLSAGQTLRFRLTPVAEASSTGEDRVAFPDPGPSGILPGTVPPPSPSGSAAFDPVFSQFVFGFLAETSASASASASSSAPPPGFGVPDENGNLYGSYEALTDQTLVFGLSGYSGSPYLDYRFDFALVAPPAAVPAPGLAAAAMGAAAASGLGFLRRRKRKR